LKEVLSPRLVFACSYLWTLFSMHACLKNSILTHAELNGVIASFIKYKLKVDCASTPLHKHHLFKSNARRTEVYLRILQAKSIFNRRTKTAPRAKIQIFWAPDSSSRSCKIVHAQKKDWTRAKKRYQKLQIWGAGLRALHNLHCVFFGRAFLDIC
jgi:hypothetical protein